MKKILVIEDMQSLREEILETLKCLEYEVLGAEDGTEGIQLAQQYLPDLIICDIMMPGIDGYGVLEALRQQTETATIPFIFLSAKADKSSVRQGMNLGADDYLTKPFTIDELRAAIAVRLEKQAARQISETKLRQSERLFRQLAQREALLNRLTRQIRNSLDLKTILSAAVNEIGDMLGVDRCRFVWYRTDVTPHYFEPIHETGKTGANQPDYNLLEWATGLDKQVGKHQVFRLDNIATAESLPASSRESLLNAGLASLLAISIQTNSGRIGLVICETFERSCAWQDSEVELLQAVADHLAIAIDQGELYAQSRFAATTAQIQAQQLERALNELQHTQAQLIQTEKMSSLGQLVAGVAHEINNPVNFIYGNVDYLRGYVRDLLELLQLYQQQYPQPERQIQDQLEKIDIDFLMEDLFKVLSSMEMGSDRIREIVSSLRNFSRLDEAGTKQVDIREGIDNTLLILQSRLKASGDRPAIEVIKDYGELPLIECYAGQLNQVFMNLLGNAIDALEEHYFKHSNSPLEITIRTLNLPPDRIAVEISDSGAGMPPEVRKRIFDPFFTTKPVGKGTGLGLSISYQIVVEKHQGIMECFSERGKGTKFIITIPIKLPKRQQN